MAKRRTQREILEARLRAGGMTDGGITDVLRAFDGPKRPRLPDTMMVALLEGRPLTITRASLEVIFGPGYTAYELRPYRARGGLMAARLMPLPLSVVPQDAPAHPAAAVPPVDPWDDDFPVAADKVIRSLEGK